MALGKSSQNFAGIAEHDTPGAKAIDNIFGEVRPIGRSEGFFTGVLSVEVGDGFLDHIPVGDRECIFAVDRVD